MLALQSPAAALQTPPAALHIMLTAQTALSLQMLPSASPALLQLLAARYCGSASSPRSKQLRHLLHLLLEAPRRLPSVRS